MLKRNLRLVVGILIGAGFTAGLAWAAVQNNYLGAVFVSDPTTPTQQLKINSDGSINTQGESGGAPTPTTPGQLTPLGFQNIPAATLASATALTVPTGATIAYVAPGGTGSPGTNGVCVMWRDDGLAPTGTVGMPLGQLQYYNGYTAKPVAGAALSAIQFIEAAGSSSCNLSVSYYK